MSKYTREVLEKAVAESNSIADVLRRLGLRLDGGTHAHISWRIKKFGIDTSSFTGQIHNRGRPARNRLSPEERLTILPSGSRRTPGQRLMRSLLEIGRTENCELCGIGPEWNGLPLTLHIDHVNGNFLDNRADNLRILCPHCHSQTPTYGNRSRLALPRVRTKPRSNPDRPKLTEHEVLLLMRQAATGEITATDATRTIGCSYATFYRIKSRLEATGSVAPRKPTKSGRSPAGINAVIAHALENPEHGARTIANKLHGDSGLRMSHGTVATILKEAGLGTRIDRRTAAAERTQMQTGSPIV